VTEPQFLPGYFDTLDAQALDVLPMLAPGFTFSFLWSDEGGAREFTGGLDEFHGYLDQRQAEGQRHHIDVGTREGQIEVVLGHTTRYGNRLGTFTFALWLDADGKAERLYSTRTLAFGDVDVAPAGAGETTQATLLPTFLDTLDERPGDVPPLLAPDLQFAVLWSDERGVNEFAGGLEQYQGYLAQREPEGQRHHLAVTARAGRAEVGLGYTTKYREELGTFSQFVQADERERVQRFFAGRTLAFRGLWSDDPHARSRRLVTRPSMQA
jgi:hypothetical protein